MTSRELVAEIDALMTEVRDFEAQHAEPRATGLEYLRGRVLTLLEEAQTVLADRRYLLVNPRTAEDYLGFGATFVTEVVHITQPWGDRAARVVSVPAEHAQWQLDRLRSGLCTESHTIFDSLSAALAGDSLS